jgi:SAM-dependent methyltransferase
VPDAFWPECLKIGLGHVWKTLLALAHHVCMSEIFFGDPAYYARWAKAYDTMAGSTLYNKVFWGSNPREYAIFAARAIASGKGPLLEVAVGTAQATATLHVAGARTTTLVDMSGPMLKIARESIAHAAGGTVPERITLECRDMLAPTGDLRYETILGLGLLHLVPDVATTVSALGRQLEDHGKLFLASLVRGSARSNAYLALLKAHGDIASIRTASELFDEVRASEIGTVTLSRRGAMAYVEISR